MISKELEVTLNIAVKGAQKWGHEYVTVEHILYALLENSKAEKVMRACGGSIEDIRKDLDEYFETKLEINRLQEDQTSQPTLGFQRVLQRSAQQVLAAGRDVIHGDAVLISITSEEHSYAVYFLQKQQISRFDMINFISHGIVKEGVEDVDLIDGRDGDEVGRLQSPSDSSSSEDPSYQYDETNKDEQSGRSKSLLKAHTVDLCEKAKQGKIDPLIGRQFELERAIQVLCRRRKNNPLFVGDAGVGKTALAEGLAGRIVENRVPPALVDTQIYSLDLGSLLAGTKFRGDFEQRFKGLIKELQKNKKAILFIDEIHTIVGAGAVNGGAMDASNILKPFLNSGEVRCMGSTTHKEYRQHFENDHAMSRRFQRIGVDEPSKEDTIQILKGLKDSYEQHHRVHYTNDAIRGAVELSIIHLKDRKLPDKAIDVLDEVGASFAALGRAVEDTSIRRVGLKDVKKVIAKMARIPEERLTETAKADIASLGDRLKEQVFGQPQAVEALEHAIRLSRSGLGNEDKPIGSFLFAGPTGVGKTELAKQLSLTLGIEFIRFDMSEYMERHAVSRLIGAPPGYVGYDDGGLLTDAIHKSPYTVLLLDEIEKAHQDVHNILLQIMDHGTLTDSNGRETDFRNTILIMTTNVGAEELTRESIGFARTNELSGKEKEALKKAFTPEFRNRLDWILSFNPLPSVVMLQIVDKFVRLLQTKLASKKVELRLTNKARELLAKLGYDPAYGARPMVRVIDKKLKRPLADELLFGELKKGGIVTADVDGETENIIFSCVQKPARKQEKREIAS